MRSTKYILWEEQGQWYGYLQDYPDYMAYGKSFEDLQFKLRDLQRDLDGQEDDRSQYATPRALREDFSLDVPHFLNRHALLIYFLFPVECPAV
jgi:hypothetical protein